MPRTERIRQLRERVEALTVENSRLAANGADATAQELRVRIDGALKIALKMEEQLINDCPEREDVLRIITILGDLGEEGA